MAEPVYPQFITSFQLNAPQMPTNTTSDGQMLSVLDAALLTGCCPNTVASVEIVGETVKLTFGVLHGYMLHQFLVLAGATSPLLNGKHRITAVTETTVSIAKGAITDISGTITTLIAPLGWESLFGTADPLKRAYRSKDATSTKTVLYLDCSFKSPKTEYVASGTRFKRAAVVVCKNMTTLGVAIEPYTPPIVSTPTNIRDGQFHWMQAVEYTPNYELNGWGYPTPWVICGDGKFFYFFIGYSMYYQDEAMSNSNRMHLATTRRSLYFFGDLPRVSVADRNPCVFSATEVNLPESKTTSFPDSSYYGQGGNLNQVAGGIGGAYFVEDLTNPKIKDPLRMNSNIGGGAYSGGYDAMNPTNPLTFGYPFSEVSAARANPNFYAGKMPYLKAVGVNLRYYPDGIDLKMHGNHLMVRVASGLSADYNTYNCYVGLDLLTPREEDKL